MCPVSVEDKVFSCCWYSPLFAVFGLAFLIWAMRARQYQKKPQNTVSFFFRHCMLHNTTPLVSHMPLMEYQSRLKVGQLDSQTIGDTTRTVSISKLPVQGMWVLWTTSIAIHTGSPMSVRHRNAVLVGTNDLNCWSRNRDPLAHRACLPTECSVCPLPGYRPLTTQKCYKLVEDGTTWTDAVKACTSGAGCHGKLAEPRNKLEFALFNNIFGGIAEK